MDRPFEQPWLLLLLAVLVMAVLVVLIWLRPRRPRRNAAGSADAGTEPPTPALGIPAADIQAALSERAQPELVGARAELGAAGTRSESAPAVPPVGAWVEPAPTGTELAETELAETELAETELAETELAETELAETELAEPADDDPALADELESAPHSAMQGLAGITGELAESAASAGSPYGLGSALPGPDGSAPAYDFSIKGNAASKLYHTADSPYYGRTRADVWFRSEVDARRAGFAPWNRKARMATAAADPPFEDGVYPGSARPRSDGAAPTEEFTVKASETAKAYFTPHSPHFHTTRADVWFRSEADARRAGFTTSGTG